MCYLHVKMACLVSIIYLRLKLLCLTHFVPDWRKIVRAMCNVYMYTVLIIIVVLIDCLSNESILFLLKNHY